jgi:Cu2+-exporting ATPase
MEVTVRHYLPGRVRLHVPELARKEALAEAALAWLRTQPGILTARLNEACASLVIEYDRAYEPILQGILTHLRGVSSRQLATFVAASAGGGKPEAGGSPQAVPSKPVPQSAESARGFSALANYERRSFVTSPSTLPPHPFRQRPSRSRSRPRCRSDR